MSALNIKTNYTYSNRFVILSDDNILDQVGYISGNTGGISITTFEAGNVNIGYEVGKTGQGNDTIALGNNAGKIEQGNFSVAIGAASGNTSQGNYGIAIGDGAGQINQSQEAIAIGSAAGNTSQGFNAVAIGNNAGQAGATGQGDYAVAIGNNAGQEDQGVYAIAIGFEAGKTEQGFISVAIGEQAGEEYQSERSVAVGSWAGRSSQGNFGIAIGDGAGQINQSQEAIAIGSAAGNTSQGFRAIAIGLAAGQSNMSPGATGQGQYAIAIGDKAGQYGQGQASIAIGQFAGQTGQAENSIVINASENGINGGETGALYIAPIRPDITPVGNTGAVMYDISTNEVYYNTSKTFVIDHPVDTSKYLVHACLEGPEAGVYYRGKDEIEISACLIELPEYVSKLAKDFTVHLTPIYKFGCPNVRNLICTEVEDGKFSVHGEPGPFSWMVFASRGSIEVEPSKSDVEVKGDGPYKYI
jgi:hypothetical protein